MPLRRERLHVTSVRWLVLSTPSAFLQTVPTELTLKVSIVDSEFHLDAIVEGEVEESVLKVIV
jgi:hypothetical protein